MKAATLHQIKKELETSSPQRVMDLILKLIKYKSENKELISYLLFDQDDLSTYIADLREEVSTMLGDVEKLLPYMVKRTLRKTLRFITKFSKYTGSKEVEAELLVHFCKIIKEKGIVRYSNKMISGIYYKQLEKIEKLILSLHEELQFDYTEALRKLKY
ncbi:MAG: hypothetical protein IPL08_07790 [Saprospiraceae bacterium]|nr:hypothetical protein [Saprospiraceae bacterium]MBK8668238.1 hypothetical protein [Saprospiraceae bacterium]